MSFRAKDFHISELCSRAARVSISLLILIEVNVGAQKTVYREWAAFVNVSNELQLLATRSCYGRFGPKVVISAEQLRAKQPLGKQ